MDTSRKFEIGLAISILVGLFGLYIDNDVIKIVGGSGVVSFLIVTALFQLMDKSKRNSRKDNPAVVLLAYLGPLLFFVGFGMATVAMITNSTPLTIKAMYVAGAGLVTMLLLGKKGQEILAKRRKKSEARFKAREKEWEAKIERGEPTFGDSLVELFKWIKSKRDENLNAGHNNAEGRIREEYERRRRTR